MMNHVLANFNILGCLDTSVARDVLLVGSQTHVLAYDVDNNKELFHNAVRIMIILSPSKEYNSCLNLIHFTRNIQFLIHVSLILLCLCSKLPFTYTVFHIIFNN